MLLPVQRYVALVHAQAMCLVFLCCTRSFVFPCFGKKTGRPRNVLPIRIHILNGYDFR